MRRSSVARLCFALLILCIPASMLCVIWISSAGMSRLQARLPELQRFVASIATFFPSWPQYFAVQTIAAAIALGAVLYWVGQGDAWLRAPRLNWRHAFPALMVAYAAWCGLSSLWSVWPYGTRAYVIRELPFFFLAVAAMYMCGRGRRWVTVARAYAGSALAAAALQTVLIFQGSRGDLSSLWSKLADEPLIFGVPYVALVASVTALLACIVGLYLHEEGKAPPALRRAFLIAAAATAASLVLFFLSLDGTLRSVLKHVGGTTLFSKPKIDYHRVLRRSFRTNPLFYGNVNFSVGILITAAYLMIAFGVLSIARFLHPVKDRDEGTSGEASAPAARRMGQADTALLIAGLLAAVAVLGFVFVIAGSLAGKVALAASGYAFLVCVLPLRRRLAFFAAPVALGLATAALVLAVPSWREAAWQRATREGSTTHMRVIYSWACSDMFVEKPLRGWGAGTFPAVYPAHRPPLASKLRYTRWMRPTSPHNEYVRVLCELGVIGALFYVGALVFAFATSYRALQDRPFRMRMIGYALWSGTLAFAVQATFSKAPMSWTTASSFWLLLGVLASASHWLGRPAPAREDRGPLRLSLDGVAALAVMACLVGWGWWQWGVGSYKSMTTLRLAGVAQQQINTPGIRWHWHGKLREKLELLRPRCLWPTQVTYHDYTLGWFLANRGHWPEGARLLGDIQGYAPEFLKTRMLLAQCYAGMGSMARARRDGTTYILLNPYDPDGYERLARFDAPTAARLIEQHLASDPEDVRMNVVLARLYLQMAERREMLADPDAFLAANPYDLTAHKFVRLRDELRAEDPDGLETWSGLVRHYGGMDLTSAASGMAEKGLANLPDDMAGYRTLAQADAERAVLLLEALLDKQRRETQQMLSDLPQRLVPPTTLALAAMLSPPNRSDLRSKLLARELDPPIVIKDLEKLLSLEQKALATAAALGRLHMRLGNKEAARALANGMLRADPLRGDATELLIELDPAAGRQRLVEAVRLAPRIAQLHLRLAQLYLEDGEHDRAEMHALEALRGNPMLLASYDILAAVNLQGAIELLGRQAHRKPAQPPRDMDPYWVKKRPARLALAELYLKADNPEKAIPEAREAQRLEPQDLKSYSVLYRADPDAALELLSEYTRDCADVAALQMLLRLYAEQGRWEDAAGLVTEARKRTGIRDFVLVVPAAAQFARDENIEALARLKETFRDVFPPTVPSADDGSEWD